MKVTIADIAKMAGVSKATVSRVINNKPWGVSEEVREKILSLIEEVGYQPNRVARSLATSNSRELAIILPDITNPFFPVLVRGVEDYARGKDYNVFLCNSDGDEEKERQHLLNFFSKQVAGVILVSNAGSHDWINDMPGSRPPLVLLDRQVKGMECEALIQADNTQGGYLATAHLLKIGRKRVAHLTGKESIDVVRYRLEGYRKALGEYKVEFDPALVHYGRFTLDEGARMAKELLESGVEFDSVFCGNDLIAMSAIRVFLQHRRKVPEDVAVVGFDNIAVGKVFAPSLTTIDQRPYHMGQAAARTLVDIVEGREEKERNILLPGELVIRESTRGGMRYG